MEKILYVIEVVLGFGGLIFIHELGHFLLAKRAGVKVLRFAIGFDFWGLRLFKKTIGETEYVIGAFPLGGYVKMLGQEDLPTEGEEEEALPDGHFLSKSVWARTQIISGGVIANFLLAFLLAYGAFVFGYHRYPNEIGGVGFDSLEAGMKPGDVIESVGGDRVESWTEMFMAYALAEPGQDIQMVVRRDGELVELMIPVLRDPDQPINLPDFDRATGLQIAAIEAESAASRAGVQAGDTLVSVNGIQLDTWNQFSSLVAAEAGQNVQLGVQRLEEDGSAGAVEVLEMTLGETDDYLAPTRALGFGAGEPPIVDGVLPDSPGAQAGLKAGDRFQQVGGVDVATWRDAWILIEYAEADVPLPITVLRDEQPVKLALIPQRAPHWAIGVWGLPGIGAIHRAPGAAREIEKGGVSPSCGSEEVEIPGIRIGWLDPDGPAAEAGLQVGDIVTKLTFTGDDGEPVEKPAYSWNYTYSVLARNTIGEGYVNLDFIRDDRAMSKAVELVPDPQGKRRGLVGVMGVYQQEFVRLGPIEAIVPSLRKPFTLFDEFLKGFRAMFTGRVSPTTIAGPMGILDVTYDAASQGFGDLLLLLALISVNLAIINFLPIPITDGGHAMFLLYEKVRGRRMSEAVQGKLMWAGLVFILMIFVFATWNDIGRIF